MELNVDILEAKKPSLNEEPTPVNTDNLVKKVARIATAPASIGLAACFLNLSDFDKSLTNFFNIAVVVAGTPSQACSGLYYSVGNYKKSLGISAAVIALTSSATLINYGEHENYEIHATPEVKIREQECERPGGSCNNSMMDVAIQACKKTREQTLAVRMPG